MTTDLPLCGRPGCPDHAPGHRFGSCPAPEGWQPCGSCEGWGFTVDEIPDLEGYGDTPHAWTCKACDGRGIVQLPLPPTPREVGL